MKKRQTTRARRDAKLLPVPGNTRDSTSTLCVLPAALEQTEHHDTLSDTKHSLTGQKPDHAHCSYVPSTTANRQNQSVFLLNSPPGCSFNLTALLGKKLLTAMPFSTGLVAISVSPSLTRGSLSGAAIHYLNSDRKITGTYYCDRNTTLVQ